jgi:Inner membrane component of T3SS, cytoplasmic domain
MFDNVVAAFAALNPMAYLIISSGGEELARRELRETLVIGRAPDCDVSVHDILLSRKHCHFEPEGKNWAIVDLASKNGTRIGSEKVDRKVLNDGQIVAAGKTRITFRTGSLIPGPVQFKRPKAPIAVDPSEALAGTVSGFEYVEPKPTALNAPSLPKPKPRPADPVSFARDDIYSMLEEIASSSWDSIYEVNAQPIRTGRSLPRPMIRAPHTSVTPMIARPRRPELSFALQATEPIEPRVEVRSGSPVVVHKRPVTADVMTLIARRAKVRLARMSRWVSRTSYLRFF